MKNLKLVVGVEDKTYFHWQLPILLESLRDQLPPEWEVWVVQCSEWSASSKTLARIVEAYGCRLMHGRHPGGRIPIDFAGRGEYYPPLNRIEALRVAAQNVDDRDLVFLAETDIFLFGALDPQVFPEGNALQENWLVARSPFLTGREGDARGIDLEQLLRAMGCARPFLPGGVSVFLDAPTLRNRKVVDDCFRFAQILYLAARISGARKAWIAEMACYALSLHANEIAYELLNSPAFSIQSANALEIPEGSFYHYYFDPKDGGGSGAFAGDDWCKQDYYRRDFLAESTPEELEARASATGTEHGRAFFRLARRARERLYG